MNVSNKHISVLFNETINSLDIKEDGIYVDLTLGRAGHARKVFQKLGPKGLFIGFDKDDTAIKYSEDILSKIGNNFILIKSDFKNIKDKLEEHGISKVDGIYADLGVSSPQIDNADRGFSYNKDSKLDMRMDQSQEFSALNLINNYSESELVNIFVYYADVSHSLSRRVAKAIVNNRPIIKTLELVNLIRSNTPAPVLRKKNIVKKYFQAIRIEVNDEINSLKKMTIDSPYLLQIGGILSIISFHSLEDKIIKKQFSVLTEDTSLFFEKEGSNNFISKTIKVKKNEIEKNYRARSSKLRVLKRIK
ncbi:MAG: 16S rRNA (cytosine(1402)-N(4))-methyltransferase RsmH [Mollicutes bacterium PWAP]|nr:16S rRNA (cytosine(1402)-N(4))-methyltransferase RsmH [Mollicutes bacterium PWAP]